MAWIESHQELERHPKTIRLSQTMKWDIDQTIGKLHRFWWWCFDYALDGDLRKFNDGQLAQAVGLPNDLGKQFVEAMSMCGGKTASGFIDRDPYFRVHDWWGYVRYYLQKNREPEIWEPIKALYAKNRKPTGNRPETDLQTEGTNQPTNQPDQPNQPTEQTLEPPGSGGSIILTFPVKGLGEKEWHLRSEKLAQYREAFPAIDVLNVIKHARQWCIDNPINQKTFRGMPAFLTTWLGREQNRGGYRNVSRDNSPKVLAKHGKYDKFKTPPALPKMPEKTTGS